VLNLLFVYRERGVTFGDFVQDYLH